MDDKIKVLTPVKAIRAKCLDCSNLQWSEVKRCPIKSCVLYPYRLGHRPKKDADGYFIPETEEELKKGGVAMGVLGEKEDEDETDTV